DTTVTVTHGKTPAAIYIDLGEPGDSPGDQRIFRFDGTSTDNDNVVMDWVMTTTGNADHTSELESRITFATFSFGDNAKDSLLIQGVSFYPITGSTVKVDTTLERATIGGTGKYAGATGTVVTTHLPNDTWQHVFTLDLPTAPR
ncbi:MAG TPA: hypothetical protein VIC02_06145, partial [Kineobactrum sp.]